MDTYVEFSFHLNEPEGPQNEPSDPSSSSAECFDILVDAERVGASLSVNYCVIC